MMNGIGADKEIRVIVLDFPVVKTLPTTLRAGTLLAMPRLRLSKAAVISGGLVGNRL